MSYKNHQEYERALQKCEVLKPHEQPLVFENSTILQKGIEDLFLNTIILKDSSLKKKLESLITQHKFMQCVKYYRTMIDNPYLLNKKILNLIIDFNDTYKKLVPFLKHQQSSQDRSKSMTQSFQKSPRTKRNWYDDYLRSNKSKFKSAYLKALYETKAIPSKQENPIINASEQGPQQDIFLKKSLKQDQTQRILSNYLEQHSNQIDFKTQANSVYSNLRFLEQQIKLKQSKDGISQKKSREQRQQQLSKLHKIHRSLEKAKFNKTIQSFLEPTGPYLNSQRDQSESKIASNKYMENLIQHQKVLIKNKGWQFGRDLVRKNATKHMKNSKSLQNLNSNSNLITNERMKEKAQIQQFLLKSTKISTHMRKSSKEILKKREMFQSRMDQNLQRILDSVMTKEELSTIPTADQKYDILNFRKKINNLEESKKLYHLGHGGKIKIFKHNNPIKKSQIEEDENIKRLRYYKEIMILQAQDKKGVWEQDEDMKEWEKAKNKLSQL